MSTLLVDIMMNSCWVQLIENQPSACPFVSLPLMLRLTPKWTAKREMIAIIPPTHVIWNERILTLRNFPIVVDQRRGSLQVLAPPYVIWGQTLKYLNWTALKLSFEKPTKSFFNRSIFFVRDYLFIKTFRSSFSTYSYSLVFTFCFFLPWSILSHYFKSYHVTVTWLFKGKSSEEPSQIDSFLRIIISTDHDQLDKLSVQMIIDNSCNTIGLTVLVGGFVSKFFH